MATALGILFIRLWFLQVIGGARYQEQATENRVRTIVTEAPRGVITDRNGVPLVTNRAGEDVVGRPQDLRGARGREVLARLARKLEEPPARLIKKVFAARATPYQSVILAEDVPRDLQLYLSERQADFPGVSLQATALRAYPLGTTAAQVLGYVGAIPPAELGRYRRQGVLDTERVGRDGIESQYQSYLRGTPGVTKVEVDAAGEPVRRKYLSSTLPQQGDKLELTLDVRVQRALEDGLRRARAQDGNVNAAAGVAMDPNTGEILGMASIPSYDPGVFVGGKPKELRHVLSDPNNPLLNRAIQGLYPAGSTFKGVSAVAALQTGKYSEGELLDAPSEIVLHKQRFKGPSGDLGQIDLQTALEASSDTFFYQLGDRFYSDPGTPLQDWAERFGFGRRSGIDLPSEDSGLVPTPEWRRRYYAAPRGNEFDRIWFPGRTIQLAIGQEGLTITPLQLAVAYSAIANGGKVVTPSVGRRVFDQRGAELRDLVAGRPAHELGASGATLDSVRNGLRLAANGPLGTSTSVFGALPEGARVAGKTGTAQNTSGIDHSWFVGYAPYYAPKILVAVIVERGGRGASAAAPVVCRTMSAYFRFGPNRCGTGAEAN
jgi:penicillin-binding protein 2